MDPCNGNDEFETKPDTACGLDYDALCWALVEEEKSLFNKPRKEDFRQRQRRMQAEYTNALATLGIKSVTFHSTIYQSDSEKTRNMLTDATQARSHELMLKQDQTMLQSTKGIAEVQEAYQYLIQKFVETEEGVEAGLAISQEDLNRRKSKSNMTPVKSYDVRRGSIQSWNGSDDSARQSRRNSFIEMTGIDWEEMEDNDKKASDAAKLVEKILTPLHTFKPKHASQRRKSILNPVEEKPLMDVSDAQALVHRPSLPGSIDSLFSNRPKTAGNRVRSQNLSKIACLATAANAAAAFKKRGSLN